MKRGKSIELQTLETLRIGLEIYLREHGVHFKIISKYIENFNKCFTTSNILSYRNLKINQLKPIIEKFIRTNNE